MFIGRATYQLQALTVQPLSPIICNRWVVWRSVKKKKKYLKEIEIQPVLELAGFSE